MLLVVSPSIVHHHAIEIDRKERLMDQEFDYLRNIEEGNDFHELVCLL